MRPGPLRIGQDFGPRYHVLKLLGSGGMGVVYQALDRELNVEIALKVLRAPARSSSALMSVAEMQRRFKTELILARKITHRNVIRIHDIGELDGIRFISMPLVKGQDVATMLRGGALPVANVVRYARQIAAGLVAVHAAGVIHRDLKPANLMIDDEDQAVLMDFGIARSNAPALPGRTMPGAIVGTAAYMAPEQARGEAADERTDIYACGLILYEMAYGPRQSVTMAELVARMKTAPQPDSQMKAAVPDALQAVITRCLQPAAKDRYQTAAALAAALAGLSDRRQRPMAAVGRWGTPAAVALLLLALLGGGYWATTRRGAATLAEGRRLVAQSLQKLNPAAYVDVPALLEMPAVLAAAAGGVFSPEDETQEEDEQGAHETVPPAPQDAVSGVAPRTAPARASGPVRDDAGDALLADAAADPQADLAASYLAAADARAGAEDIESTVAAVRRALDVSRHETVMLAAARVLLSVDRTGDARALARELETRGAPGRAYARLIDGEVEYGTCRPRK